ncbi:hypothetical protein AAFC00_006658 [Neodothiora populina]|uniref:Metal homeostatis protein bsd2 n=1 Tax=Neodothiora populina TaxID=2781224 RepID=A0ABR3PB45_9PEZI
MYFGNYERLPATDTDDVSPRSPSRPFPPTSADQAQPQSQSSIPDSPPPSFRSRVSSRRTSSEQQRLHNEEHDRDLDDAFAAPSDDESDNDDQDAASSRRLVRSDDRAESTTSGHGEGTVNGRSIDRRVTEINMFMPGASQGGAPRVYGGGQSTNDGVFANISAKPTPGEELEEKPPTYEQAAADATPPYWETTILAPGAFNSDDVFVDGLVVGSLFSFVWNALISMSFQLIGFLLTYLLHTTHAAKHGSRAGLGITLIQYGFTFRAAGSDPVDTTPGVPGNTDPSGSMPSDPNDHDFDPGMLNGGGAGVVDTGISTSDWISYALMIAGWFILIRAVSDFIRARRQEEMVRASPDRGLGVAVIAENERPETAV